MYWRNWYQYSFRLQTIALCSRFCHSSQINLLLYYSLMLFFTVLWMHTLILISFVVSACCDNERIINLLSLKPSIHCSPASLTFSKEGNVKQANVVQQKRVFLCLTGLFTYRNLTTWCIKRGKCAQECHTHVFYQWEGNSYLYRFRRTLAPQSSGGGDQSRPSLDCSQYQLLNYNTHSTANDTLAIQLQRYLLTAYQRRGTHSAVLTVTVYLLLTKYL